MILLQFIFINKIELHFRHSQVARLSVNDITANIDQRPAANALK